MKALVIGGTGPSGPHIVNGLISRGYDVSVLHGGQHEIRFDEEIEHIHVDPHFQETLESGLVNRTFDLTIATYGRIRIAAEVVKGKTERLITVGGGGVYAQRDDPRWGSLGAPLMVKEDSPLADNPNGPRLPYMMWVTEKTVMNGHQKGYYKSTIFRYPQIYGPNAPANPEWSIVRRILDSRKHFILPNLGLPRRRSFGQNAAHALLLSVDKPKQSEGQIYNVREEYQYSQRHIVEFITKFLNYDWELTEMPFSIANKVYKGDGAPEIETTVNYDITKIKAHLGYEDLITASDALSISINWLVENRPDPGGEIEMQLGDPFAYSSEDELISAYKTGLAKANKIRFPKVLSGHMYRHPQKPGEAWAPPSHD